MGEGRLCNAVVLLLEEEHDCISRVRDLFICLVKHHPSVARKVRNTYDKLWVKGKDARSANRHVMLDGSRNGYRGQEQDR